MKRTSFIVEIICPDCGYTWTTTATKEYGIMNFDESKDFTCENCGAEGEAGDCTYFKEWRIAE